ncbi:MAG: 50S ribosomal protein L15 [Pseudomonadota bacterium]
MRLNEISDNHGANKTRKRVGRGIGSGKGKQAGRGGKGQTARSGVSINGFEGGQMPIHRRLPKRGFKSRSRNNFAEVNLGDLQTALDAGKLDAKKTIDQEALVNAGLARSSHNGVRLLGTGELKTKVTLNITGGSKAAIAALEKIGGKIELPAPKKKAVKGEKKVKAEKPAKAE